MGEVEEKILENILDELRIVSDLEYQLRVWIRGIGPECHFYDDVVCNFFWSAKDVINNYQRYGINNKQKESLEFFYDIFKSFSDAQLGEPFEFIDTPEWQHVVDEAKKVLEAFDYKKP